MLDGCEIHAQSQADVVARWSDPRIEDARGEVTLCVCCWGPALAEMRQAFEFKADGTVMDVLPGGISNPVRCSRCATVTDEQAAELMARLREGYPVSA